MKRSFLLKTLLVATLATSAFSEDIDAMPGEEYEETTSKATMQVGLTYGLMNFGGSLSDESESIDVDTEDTPLTISFAFLFKNDNKFGFYYKTDELALPNISDSGTISTNTFGVLGEVGFSSIKAKIGEGELLPYFGYGLGYGSAEASWTSIDLSAFEADLSFGAHYTIQSFEVSAAIYRRAISVFDESDTVTYAMNGINLGVGYKF